MCYEETRVMKPLEDMDVIDDFLFTEIMADKEDGAEVCRMILSLVLKRDIRVYDVEPDKQSSKKKLLPKRSRYYGDLIDVQLLETGMGYDKLPELVTIFILSYDPFGRNSLYYEAGSILKTHSDIPYNDGIRRIFLYVDGDLPENAGEDEKKLKNLLRYIGKSTKANVTDDITGRLNDIVHRTKAKKGIGISYMKSWEREAELIEEGKRRGLRMGREEELKNTEAERKRTEIERKRADEAEAKLKKYIEKYGVLI